MGITVDRPHQSHLPLYPHPLNPQLFFARLGAVADGSGVEKNESEAASWYRKAAEQGDARAQSDLVQVYELGKGVVKNDVEAYYWCLLAAAQGDETERRHLTVLESKLPDVQRIVTQIRASEFKAGSQETDE